MSRTATVAWFLVWWMLSIVIMLGLERLAYGDVKAIHFWTLLVSLIITVPTEVYVMNRIDPPDENA